MGVAFKKGKQKDWDIAAVACKGSFDRLWKGRKAESRSSVS